MVFDFSRLFFGRNFDKNKISLIISAEKYGYIKLKESNINFKFATLIPNHYIHQRDLGQDSPNCTI